MIYSDFAPLAVEINSLGIGLINSSNIEDLDLDTSEFLVVGEQYSITNNSRDIKYSLIVNRDGVAVNSTRRQVDASFANSVKNSGLYVDSDIICDGNIIAKGLQFSDVKFDGFNSNILEDILTSVNNINPLFYKGYTVLNGSDSTAPVNIDNIYTPSFVTLGSVSDTYNNTNTLNIATTANNNINNVHIAMLNKITNEAIDEPAKFRIGLIGDAAESPAVISTTTGMPLEFHVGRTTNEMNALYAAKDSFPDYVTNSNLLPALIIDANNNVGISAVDITEISFSKYEKINDLNIVNKTALERPKIKVGGSAQIENVVTYDYYSKSYKHIDDIFIRKEGINFKANQIMPGEFVKGTFGFNSNVFIGHAGDDYTLEVNRVLDVKGDLHVAEDSYFNNITVNNATFNNDTVFDNDIYINKDVVLDGDITLNSGDLIIANTRINVASLHPVMVDASIAAASNISGSNILIFATNDVLQLSGGSNLVVPGRVGVGVLSSNQYNEQFNVIKRNPKIYEMMLQDESEDRAINPAAYFGHLATLSDINYQKDRSLIINTNDTTELHNIYFYPGVNLNRQDVNTATQPPTLSVHQAARVGINTANPQYTLDVQGEMLVKDIYINVNNVASKSAVFILKKDAYAPVSDTSRDFYYLYDKGGATKFCINFDDKTGVTLKGLNVKGGIHSINDGYFEDGVKLATLKIIDPVAQTMAFTNKNLCIGWNTGDANIGAKPLNIRNLSTKDYNDSIIRLYRGRRVGGARNSAKFSGLDICDYETASFIKDRNLYKWFLYKNHLFTSDELDVGPMVMGYTDGTQHPTHFGMTMHYNKWSCNYHIDINNPVVNTDQNARKSAMSIYGNLDVYGNINILGTSNNYKINGITVSPNALNSLSTGSTGSGTSGGSGSQGSGTIDALNDVVVTGKNIAMLPTKTMAIGHYDDAFVGHLSKLGESTNSYNVPLTVYQNASASTITKFLSAYNPTLPLNSAAIELGIFDVTANDYNGKKKNSVEIKVSNFGPQSGTSTKTLLEIGSYYDPDSQAKSKLLSVYSDGYSSYFNLGGKASCHNQDTGELQIGELYNVGLHVENTSKYILQLTNSYTTPAINLHRNSVDADKFWVIEGPDDQDRLVIKRSEGTDTYLPESNLTRNALVITRDGTGHRFGLNVDDPEYSFDLKGANDISAMHIANKYSELSLSEKLSAIKVINSNLEYGLLPAYTVVPVFSEDESIQSNQSIYSFDTSTNTYYSGMRYFMDKKYFPSKDILGNDLPFNFLITSNFVKNTTKITSNLFTYVSSNSLMITSNNKFVNIGYDAYTCNVVSVGGSVNINMNNSISVLPTLPILNNNSAYQDVGLTIDSRKIRSGALAAKNSVATVYESDFQFNINYAYSNMFEYLSSNASLFRHQIITPQISGSYGFDATSGSFTSNLYTTNTIKTFFDKAGTNVSKTVNTQLTVPFSISSRNYINYISTKHEFWYNSNDTYQLDMIARIQNALRYYTEVDGPSTIMNSNIQNTYTYSVSGLLDDSSKTVNLASATSYLNTVPYGAYDGYNYADNIVQRGLRTQTVTYTVPVLNRVFNYTLNIDDRYSVYDFNINSNYSPFFVSIRNIDYKPHIILQNNIDFTDNTDAVFGKVNKIYSKDGSIKIVSEDADAAATNVLLDLTDKGDAKFEGVVYTNKMVVDDIVVTGNIFDRLGNSIIIDYNEDMYNKAFVLQSSNYILHTCNYAITASDNYSIESRSNVDFILTGRDNTGMTIYKKDVFVDGVQNDYNLFKIYEDEYTAFSIRNGGKVGIKVDRPEYDLDVYGDIRAGDSIVGRTIHGDGANLTNVNLSDRSTSLLAEGSNLYYTAGRVAAIVIASNIETSNYVSNVDMAFNSNLRATSNVISSRVTVLNELMSNYVLTVNSNLSSNIVVTSNVISTRITVLDSMMSNYLQTTSNYLWSNLDARIITLNNDLGKTSNAISNRITDLNADYIADGNNHNRFIIDDGYFRGVTFSNVTIRGDLQVIGKSTTLVPQESCNASMFITGKTNEMSLKILRPDKDMDIMSVANFAEGYSNNDIFWINKNGQLSVGRYPNKTTDFLLDVKNKLYADYLCGDGANITNVNLGDRSTSLLEEGSNLYYTAERVATIVVSSNIETSNYADILWSNLTSNQQSTSNVISQRVTDLDVLMSNYVATVNSNLTSNLMVTSNVISTRITVVDLYMSNYVNGVNSNLSSNLQVTSNVISQRVTLLDTLMSNYVLTVNSNLTSNLQNTSNVISQNISRLDSLMSNYVATVNSNLTSNLQVTSNVISKRITALTTDDINVGVRNKFIVDDAFNYNLSVGGKLTVTDVEITNNLSVLGTQSIFHTQTYQTETLQVTTIGVDTDPAVKVDIYGNQNITEMGSSNTIYFMINKNGNVGIGTNLTTVNNNYKLSVDGDVLANNLKLKDNLSVTSNVSVGGSHTASELVHLQRSGKNNYIKIDAGDNSTYAGLMLTENSSPLGFAMRYDAALDTLMFASQDVDAVMTNRMSMTMSGNVGIGLTNPSQLLHIQKKFGDNYIKVDAGFGDRMAGLMLTEFNSNMGYAFRYDAPNDKLLFSVQDPKSSAFFDAMVMTMNSNVGIGTTTPDAGSKLQVYGKLMVGDTTVGVPAVGSVGGTGTRIVLQAGTGSAVPYALGTESGAQWYSVAEGTANYHKFYNGGYASMVIGSNNVGIGITNPGQMLHIQRSGQDNYIKVDAGAGNKMAGVMLTEHSSNMGYAMRYDAANDSLLFSVQDSKSSTLFDAMVMTMSSNVGIGTTTPDAGSKLQVYGKLLVGDTTTGAPAVGTVGGTGTRIVLQNGSGSAVPYGIGAESGAQWYSVAEGNNNYHKFYNGGYASMVIGSNNIGIGVTNPGQMLHIQRSGQDNYIKVDAGAGNKMAGVMLTEHNSNMGYAMRYDAANDSLLFSVQDGKSSTLFDAMVMTMNSNVGIGTTTPDAGSKLQVYGKLLVGDTTTGVPAVGTVGGTGTRIVLQNGSGSAVPYGIGAESGAQWYSVSEGTANYHKFYNGSYASMVIGSNNVGIGVTNPGQMLHIQRSGQDNYIKVDAGAGNKMAGVMLTEHNSNMGYAMRYDAANDSLLFSVQDGKSSTLFDAMVMTMSSNVGIGTTTPDAGSKLQVYGKLLVGDTTTGAPAVGSVGGTGTRIVLQAGTGSAVPYGIGAESGAQWYSVAEGNNNYHKFYNGGYASMVIGSNNVGIGVTNPGQMLHIQRSGQDNYIKVDAGAGNKMAGVMLTEHNSNMGYAMRYDAANDSLLFSVQDGKSSTLFDTMVMTMSSNVGIGTTVPDAGSKLQVYGKLLVGDTTTGAPATGTVGGTGTRIVLQAGTGSAVPYGIGAESGAQWYSVADGSANYHKFYNGVNASMVIGKENVGIGVTNPGQMLHIQRSGQNNYIKVDAGANDKISGIMLTKHNANNGFGMRYDATNDKLLIASQDGNMATTDASTVAITNGGIVGIGVTSPDSNSKLQVSGKVYVQGNTGSPDFGTVGGASDGTRLILNAGTSTSAPYAIGYESGALWYGVDSNGSHKFYNNKNPVATITSNLGVGVTNPLQMVHLGRTGGSNYIKVDAGGSNAFAGIMFCMTNSNLGQSIRYNPASGNLIFATQDGAGVAPTFTDRMIMARDGKIGIGKIPGYEMDVNGTINCTEILKGGQTLSQVISGSSTSVSQISDIGQVFNSKSLTIQTFSGIQDYGFWQVQNEALSSIDNPDPNISQYYCITQGGSTTNPYAAAQYAVQYAIPYGGTGDSNSSNYMYIRHRVNDSTKYRPWAKIAAGKADTLKTARSINGVPFDGSRDIYVNFFSNIVGSTKDLFYSAGNISIGSSSPPAQLLHLQKLGSSNFIRVDAGGAVVGANNLAGMMLCKSGDQNGYSVRYDGSSNDAFYLSKTNAVGAFTSNIMSLRNSGSVGIGTDDAGPYRLGVYGGDAYVNTNAYVNGAVGIGTSSGTYKFSVYGGDAYVNTNGFFNSAVGIGTASAGSYKLYVHGGDTYVNSSAYINTAVGIGTASAGSYKLYVHGGDAYVNSSAYINTAVGIGTASAGSYKLYVHGGDAYVNNNAFINTAVGIGTASAGTYKLNVYGGNAYFDASVYAKGDVISSFSDIRLKKIVGQIDDPLEKIMNINAFKYVPNDVAKSLQVGTDSKVQVGISAQDVLDVLPEVVTLAPFDSSNLDSGQTVSKSGEEYLTVSYERMVPLLIECIKQLRSEVAELRSLKSEVMELRSLKSDVAELQDRIHKLES
jgi:TRAP-type mannitol/chloroaromatic compound transport system substrate-binding protein